MQDDSVGSQSPVRVRHGSESSGSPVRRRNSRRRFLKQSLAGGSALAASAMVPALAADCDRNPAQTSRCSDNDSGENSDPTNCGRCGREETVPSSYRQHSQAGSYSLNNRLEAGQQSSVRVSDPVSGILRKRTRRR